MLANIAAMPEPDRAMGGRLHAIIRASAPVLTPRLWYGMPAYARDGNVVCFFQSREKFKTRYMTLGFSDKANLDEGAMWPTSFALKELTAAEEARIVALVKKAVSSRTKAHPSLPRTGDFYRAGAPGGNFCCESGVPPVPIASSGYSRTYTKNAGGGSFVISDAVLVSFSISSAFVSGLTAQRSIVITGIVLPQFFHFPKNSLTSCRYSRMGKCCGHFSSHSPHWIQQEANPGIPPENEPLRAQRYTPAAFSFAS